jgi:hypothetical protein
MANEGVTGRVVDKNGVGIANLVVGAFDIGLFGERCSRTRPMPAT